MGSVAYKLITTCNQWCYKLIIKYMYDLKYLVSCKYLNILHEIDTDTDTVDIYRLPQTPPPPPRDLL